MPVVNLPLATPYNSNELVAFGVTAGPSGAEGCLAAPFTLQWADLAPGTFGWDINFGERPNMPKQIATLYVDNSRCHFGVYIVFPDTGFRIVVAPFRRGYYPVLTKTTRFFAGLIASSAANAIDVTVIEALNFSVPPSEETVFVSNEMVTTSFDPAGAVGPLPLAPSSSGWSVLRTLSLQLSGMTGGAAGYNAEFRLFADGVQVYTSAVSLAAAEFVDASDLFVLTGQAFSAITWTYDWTVLAGALTAPAFAILNGSFDLADV